MLQSAPIGCGLVVAATDPSKKIAGMMYSFLDSFNQTKTPSSRPGFFLKTGLPLLLQHLKDMGATHVEVRACGLGQLKTWPQSMIDVCLNHDLLEKHLAILGLSLSGQSFGGFSSRIAKIEVRSGQFSVLSNGQETIL